RDGQRTVISAALERAGIDAADVSFVEAHGTGTALGDLIELQALGDVFARSSAADRPCIVGAVKANIGHLETAAGMAGLIKTLLCFDHSEIPAQIHLSEVNPQIDLSSTRLSIATEHVAWARGGKPRIAGISSFGFGGTNAHVIVEEPFVRAVPP